MQKRSYKLNCPQELPYFLASKDVHRSLQGIALCHHGSNCMLSLDMQWAASRYSTHVLLIACLLERSCVGAFVVHLQCMEVKCLKFYRYYLMRSPVKAGFLNLGYKMLLFWTEHVCKSMEHLDTVVAPVCLLLMNLGQILLVVSALTFPF